MEVSRNRGGIPAWVLRLERAYGMSPPASWLTVWTRWAIGLEVLIFFSGILLIVLAAPNTMEVLRGVAVFSLVLSFGGYLLGGCLYAGGINGKFVREGRIIRTVSLITIFVVWPLSVFTRLGADLLMRFDVGGAEPIGFLLGMILTSIMAHSVYRAYQREKFAELDSV